MGCTSLEGRTPLFAFNAPVGTVGGVDPCSATHVGALPENASVLLTAGLAIQILRELGRACPSTLKTKK